MSFVLGVQPRVKPEYGPFLVKEVSAVLGRLTFVGFGL
jgi:hypothetical protein